MLLERRYYMGMFSHLKHLVWAGLDARNEVVGREGGLLHLGEVVPRVPVEDHLADLDERVLGLAPDLGQVERVEGALLRLLEGHHLDLPEIGVVAC